LTSFAIDTGPLVAFLNRHDSFNEWAVETLDSIEAPLLTCEAVVAEACHLLRSSRGGSEAVLELIERKVVIVAFDLGAEVQRVRKLMNKYASVPMSLADACLVRMAEIDKALSIITLDGDFHVYRRGRAALSVVSP